MKLRRWETKEIRDASIGSINITERIEKITTKEGTTVRYSTLFYHRCIKIYEVPLPMITNKCIDNIEKESELKKYLINF